MHYFSNNFLKIAKRWWRWALRSGLNLRFWWPKVAWFVQSVVFQTNYDKVELKKLVMT